MRVKVSLLLCLATVVVARPNLLPGAGHDGQAHGTHHESAQSHAHESAQSHHQENAHASAHTSRDASSNGYGYPETRTRAPAPPALYQTPTEAPPALYQTPTEAPPTPPSLYQTPTEAPTAPPSLYEAPTRAAPPSLYEAPAVTRQEEEIIPFSYEYIVKDGESGVDFGHRTNSDGHVESGSYSVHLPDTRIMTVTYTVDDVHGYQADVSFEGEAQYPDPELHLDIRTEDHNPRQLYETPDVPDTLYTAPEIPDKPDTLYTAPEIPDKPDTLYSAPTHQ